MYTLPAQTPLRLRRPSRPLVALIKRVFPDVAVNRVTVELTTWVTRTRSSMFYRRLYAWYDFSTREVMPIYEAYQPFEIEPGYALFMYAQGDVSIYLTSFAADRDRAVALDVARDALLEGRDPLATRILREALPEAGPLFVALVRKEQHRT
jgi:hypothetical protein